ncbi:type II toxin-antitoxin system RelE/ParE family toxin [Rhizobium sp. CB3090]|uniref:type II toxin-antitoxin system RelE/ParE family toxin n=1 Tax=Rhizobium sp. CB3090 TaxID=3039156 RepID=UPI0032C20D84
MLHNCRLRYKLTNESGSQCLFQLDTRSFVIYILRTLHASHTPDGYFSALERRLRDERARAAIAARLSRLAFGLMGDIKPVGDGVNEIRIHCGPGYRVYFVQRGGEIIILCGDDNSSQAGDIEQAKTLAKNSDEFDA